jgi:hypothetical protein
MGLRGNRIRALIRLEALLRARTIDGLKMLNHQVRRAQCSFTFSYILVFLVFLVSLVSFVSSVFFC